ncbi:MAG: site-2 protease family protein [Bacillota bacterium]|nr:site-2 protease family protein [Bacillota bacterium]
MGPGPYRIRISPLYIALLALWVAGGYLTEAALALISLACHELAHLYVLAGFDIPVEAVELHPFGAVIVYAGPAEGLAATDGLVAAAGPLQSFLLAAVATFLEPLGWFAPDKLQLLIQLNLLLACFNLIPVWPLDGGRVVRAWLAPRLGDAAAGRALARAGRLVGLLTAVSGVVASYTLARPAWVPVLIGLFLWRAAGRGTGAGRESVLRTMTKARRALPHGVGAIAHLVARHDTTMRQLLRRLRGDRYHLVTVIDAGGHQLGTLTEDDLHRAMMDLGIEGTVLEAMRRRQ